MMFLGVCSGFWGFQFFRDFSFFCEKVFCGFLLFLGFSRF